MDSSFDICGGDHDDNHHTVDCSFDICGGDHDDNHHDRHDH